MVNVKLTPWAPMHLTTLIVTTTEELTDEEKKKAEEAFCIYPPYGPFPGRKKYVTEAGEKLKKTDSELAAKIVIPD